MSKTKKLVSALLLAGMVAFAGCGGVTEEQMAELEALRSEVSTLTKDINSLKSQKTELERELAVKKSRLDECKKTREEAQNNLKKMGK